MIKATIITVVFFLSTMPSANAQIRILQLSINDTSSGELYHSAENKLKVIGLEQQDKVMVGNDIIRRSGADTFLLTPTSTTAVTVKVVRESKAVFSKTFPVKPIPNSTVRLGAIKDARATVLEILSFPRLVVESGNLKNWFRILSFEMWVEGRGQDRLPIYMVGDQLSPHQKEIIKHLRAGDKVVFENIRATCPHCSTRAFGPITITIE